MSEIWDKWESDWAGSETKKFDKLIDSFGNAAVSDDPVKIEHPDGCVRGRCFYRFDNIIQLC